MKNKINKLLLVILLVIGPLIISLAQGPPAPHNAPDPLGNPGDPTSLTSTNNSSAGVPIPEGTFILLVLASIYGVSKYFQVKKQVKTA